MMQKPKILYNKSALPFILKTLDIPFKDGKAFQDGKEIPFEKIIGFRKDLGIITNDLFDIMRLVDTPSVA